MKSQAVCQDDHNGEDLASIHDVTFLKGLDVYCICWEMHFKVISARALKFYPANNLPVNEKLKVG